MERKLLKAGEVIQRAGISRQMLYSYIQIGLVVEDKKTRSGQLLFDELHVLRRLKLIQDLLAHGYTLRDMKEIFPFK